VWWVKIHSDDAKAGELKAHAGTEVARDPRDQDLLRAHRICSRDWLKV
jgi:hypothetical protein